MVVPFHVANDDRLNLCMQWVFISIREENISHPQSRPMRCSRVRVIGEEVFSQFVIIVRDKSVMEAPTLIDSDCQEIPTISRKHPFCMTLLIIVCRIMKNFSTLYRKGNLIEA